MLRFMTDDDRLFSSLNDRPFRQNEPPVDGESVARLLIELVADRSFEPRFRPLVGSVTC